MVQAAPVLPTGGVVKAGSASIGAPTGGALTVSQSSGKAIIDWAGFSIGSGGKVQFNNGKGATLNRVTGTSLSAIDGLLSGTGSVYLINPNGVIVGKNGVVNVGGSFVASTLDVTNQNFLAGGDLSFAGASKGAVINYGKVGALGGDVALIAAKVENDGSISAANGTAGLVAGYSVVLRDASLDDGKFSVLVGGTDTSVVNGGTIAAANAELRAEQGNIYALAGDTAGVVRATGVKAGQGKIWLVADKGTLDVAGTLDAQGKGGTAGAVETSGGAVNLGVASIDAHGGTWLVDPYDLEITPTAAATISTALASGNVTEQTNASSDTDGSGQAVANASGVGDITLDVNAAISWTSANTLTLSAYRNLNLNGTISLTTGTLNLTAGTGNSGAVGPNTGAILVNAPITVSGAGTVNITAANDTVTAPGGSLLELSFGPGDPLQFTGTSAGAPLGSLNINGTTYHLVNSLAGLEAGFENSATGYGLSGAYALATSVDGSNGGAGYTQTPLTYTRSNSFSGVVEGLGNSVANLTINDTSNQNVGLFGENAGVIRDLNLVGGSVSASLYYADVGALVGQVYLYNGQVSTIANVSSSVAVTGGGSAIGGLVGLISPQLSGTSILSNVSTTGAVTGTSNNGAVGGLVGQVKPNSSSSSASSFITGASATGAVTSTAFDYAGGLIGQQYAVGSNASATVVNAYATGAVNGVSLILGGLIGENIVQGGGSVTLTDVYATGSVTYKGSGNAYVGGLDGYDTNNQSGTLSITGAWAGGAVTGSYAGGLVGVVYGPGMTLTNVYALGAVSGSLDAGGLFGSASNLTLTNAYATGAVGGTAYYKGGLFGTIGAVTANNAFFDTGTTGQGNAAGFSNPFSASTMTDVQGLSTAQFMDATSPISGLGLGTTPGGASGQNFVIVDADGTLNGSNGATRPMLLSEYSTTIVNAHQLQLMELNLSTNYTLAANVDASATAGANASNIWTTAGFVPIGTNSTSSLRYAGVFNGQGHTINGLTIYRPASSYDGLFGYVTNSTTTLENVSLVGGAITGGSDVGSLAGMTALNASVVNDYTSASVTGNNSYAGGLIGRAGGPITGSYATGAVTGFQYVGGLAGGNAAVTQSYATGSVTGATYVGGLSGFSQGAVSQSYATGVVTGTGVTSSYGYLGGLLGYNAAALTQDYATGSVTGGASNQYVGGLVGDEQGGTVKQSYATGAVSSGGSSKYVGGLIGSSALSNTAITTQDYATGAVTAGNGSTDVGGLEGYDNVATSQSYALGAVSAPGGTNVGGLIGELDSSKTLTQSYATGAVTASGGTSVGGLVGNATSGSSVSNSYWDTTTTGQTTSSGGGSGVATSAFYTTSGVSGLGFSSTTPGATGFVIVDTDASLDNAGGVAGATRPLLLSEYSTSIVNAHQLQLMELAPAANYTLAANVDASATTGANAAGIWTTAGFVPVGTSSTNFTGVFNGQGFAIGGLTINQPSTNYVGLFGDVGAASILKNVSLAGGSITANRYVGALVGYNNGGAIANAGASVPVSGTQDVGGLVGYQNLGAISRSYATGAVSGVGSNSSDLGGLVGYQNSGTISQSYATGAISGGYNIGGLVGELGGGAISQSYATGAGSGSQAAVGGLVGTQDSGTISQSYATGAEHGSFYAAGLVGSQEGGTISQSYATGVPTDSYGYTGGLVGYQNSAGGATITSSYYDADTTGKGLGIQGNGSQGVHTATLQAGLPSGFASPPWSIVAGETYPYLSWQFSGTPQVVSGIAYAADGVTGLTGATVRVYANGAALASVLTGASPTTGANGYYYDLLAPGTLAISTTDKVGVTATASGSSTPIGLSYNDASLADGSTTGLNVTSGLTFERTTDTTYSALQADVPVPFGSATYNTLKTTLAADALSVQATGAFTIDQAISQSGSESFSAGGALTLNANDALASTGGNISLANTSGALTLNANVTTGTTASVALASGGAISQGSGAVITTGTLSGSSVGGATLASSNAFATLGGFSNATSGDLSFTDAQALTVTGPVSDTVGNVALTTTGANATLTLTGNVTAGTSATATLTSAGPIVQSGGAITAGTLTGSSVGAASFAQSGEAITTLGAFSTSNGGLSLTDAVTDLGISGAVNVGTGTLSLTNTTGTITQASGSAITAGTLTGSSSGAASFAQSGDAVATLSAFSTSNGGLTLTDAVTDLGVSGAVNVGTGTLSLTNSTGTITQASGSVITAGALTGSSVGTTALAGGNAIRQLGAFTVTAPTLGLADFLLADSSALSVTGAVSASAGQEIALKTDSLSFASGGSLDAGQSGAVALAPYTTGDAILVSVAGGSAANTLSLTTASLGDITTGALVLGRDDTTATPTTTAGSIELGSAGDAIDLSSVATTLDLETTGAVTQGAGATLTVATLTGAAGSVSLPGANAITTLGAFTTSTGLTLADAIALSVSGTVDGGAGAVSLAITGGDLSIGSAGSVTAGGLVGLSASGEVDVGGAVSSTGDQAVTLYADTGGTGVGTVNFSNGAKVSTTGPVSIFYNPADNTVAGGDAGAGTTVNGTSYTAPTDYTGDVSTPAALTAYMLVNTAFDLQNMQNNLAGAYALGRAVDANASADAGANGSPGSQLNDSGAGFAPIGSSTADPFMGVINGQGHAIDGLYIDRSGSAGVGLFGVVGAGGLVRNVSLTNVNITGGNSTAGLVGKNFGTVSGDSAAGVISGASIVGGLVGKNFNTVLTSTASATVSGTGRVGGLVGQSGSAGLVSASSVTAGTVTDSGTDTGGLVGYNLAGATIVNSSTAAAVTVDAANGPVGGLVGENAGSITGQSHVGIVTAAATVNAGGQAGGLVGLNDLSGVITDVEATGSLAAGGNVMGGLVGKNLGKISASSATGAVSGASHLGGLVGKNFGEITTSTASGPVSGTSYVGGLVGFSGADDIDPNTPKSISQSYATGGVTGSGTGAGGLAGGVSAGSSVADSYSTGAVNGSVDVGGLVGVNRGSIATSYTSGFVSGSSVVGGFAGASSAGALSGDYWVEPTSTGLPPVADETVDPARVEGVGGSTDNDATSPSTYSAFSMSIWGFNLGVSLPYLLHNSETPLPTAP